MKVEVVQQNERTAAFQSRTPQRIRLENILVPTDFSENSHKALDYGIAMARQFGATLSLLHIVEPTAPFTGLEAVPIVIEGTEQLSGAENRMAEFAAQHVPADVAVTSLVRLGSAVHEISDFAKTHKIDLVVATIHPHNRISRALFGGITERIVHQAPCPILIVRENEHDFFQADGAGGIRINRILAPVDFTPCSEKALRYAVAFGQQFDAEVFCLHVVETDKPLMIMETESYRKTHEIEASNNMNALIREVDGSVKFETGIVTGSPHHEIIDAADDCAVDLIVIGEHCRTGVFGRFMLGSAADEVVKGAHCPILVVRPHEHEFVT
jgi:nucleotide-binding universal stress UspA family protein